MGDSSIVDVVPTGSGNWEFDMGASWAVKIRIFINTCSNPRKVHDSDEKLKPSTIEDMDAVKTIFLICVENSFI